MTKAASAPAYVLTTPHGTHQAHCATLALAERACQALAAHYGEDCCFVQPCTGEERGAQGCPLQLLTRDEETELVLASHAALDASGRTSTRQIMTLRGLVWNGVRKIHGQPVACALTGANALALLAAHLDRVAVAERGSGSSCGCALRARPPVSACG